MPTEEIIGRTRLLENDIKVLFLFSAHHYNFCVCHVCHINFCRLLKPFFHIL